jgi:hypothetical protein
MKASSEVGRTRTSGRHRAQQKTFRGFEIFFKTVKLWFKMSQIRFDGVTLPQVPLTLKSREFVCRVPEPS